MENVAALGSVHMERRTAKMVGVAAIVMVVVIRVVWTGPMPMVIVDNAAVAEPEYEK